MPYLNKEQELTFLSLDYLFEHLRLLFFDKCYILVLQNQVNETCSLSKRRSTYWR